MTLKRDAQSWSGIQVTQGPKPNIPACLYSADRLHINKDKDLFPYSLVDAFVFGLDSATYIAQCT